MQPALSPCHRNFEPNEIASRPAPDRSVLAVALCTVINMIDGFDILAISFTAPAIGRDWHLSPQALGLLFSAGLAGMTLGALFLSPFADWKGRKSTLVWALGFVGVAMICSAGSVGIATLIGARLATGAGVGAIMPTINTITAESGFSRRDVAVSVQGAGFPIGGFLGGMITLAIPSPNWRWVYLAGAGLSLLLLLSVAIWLPRARKSATEPAAGPARISSGRGLQRRFGSLIDVRVGLSSVLICFCFFLLMFTFYFLTNWTPTLLTRLGLSAKIGVSGSILMNAGGILGDATFTLLLLRWNASRVGIAFLVLCFGTVILFAYVPLILVAILPVALFMGFLLFGSMLSLYAVVPLVYPGRARAGGTGFALGTGRIGATVGPYVGGLLIGAGWARDTFLLTMAVPLIACAALLLILARRLDDSQAGAAAQVLISKSGARASS
jgi:MFS family permease